jgi:hypothetical protein
VTGSRDEFVRVAGQALARDGAGALDSLGWWHLLEDLDDPESRTAVFAVCHAQGRCLASTPAVGALMAQPYLGLLGERPGPVAAAVPRGAPGTHGAAVFAVGEPVAWLLVDRPGLGAWVVASGDVERCPVPVAGRLALDLVDAPGGAPALTDAEAARARGRSQFLGRTALALEILGAAEGAVALAVEHAQAREQFGQPIGAFQAVRHLLAWATTDCTAIDAVAWEAVALDRATPARYADIAKALAGRNGRRACERALQVLGAVGFTAEHDHHHFHSRVLALDALLGSSAALTHELGVWRRQVTEDPRTASAMLLSP